MLYRLGLIGVDSLEGLYFVVISFVFLDFDRRDGLDGVGIGAVETLGS